MHIRPKLTRIIIDLSIKPQLIVSPQIHLTINSFLFQVRSQIHIRIQILINQFILQTESIPRIRESIPTGICILELKVLPSRLSTHDIHMRPAPRPHSMHSPSSNQELHCPLMTVRGKSDSQKAWKSFVAACVGVMDLIPWLFTFRRTLTM